MINISNNNYTNNSKSVHDDISSYEDRNMLFWIYL